MGSGPATASYSELGVVMARVDTNIGAAGRLLQWLSRRPDAMLGIDLEGLSSIARSIGGGDEPHIREMVGRWGATDAIGTWPGDVKVFDRHRARLLSCLESTSEANGILHWMPAEDAAWWIEATLRLLASYREHLGQSRRTPEEVQAVLRLLQRHRCTVFAPMKIDDLAHSVSDVCDDAGDRREQLLRILRDAKWQLASDGADQLQRSWWSFQLFQFDEVNEVLVHLPMLGLWNYWPTDPRWAPPSATKRGRPLDQTAEAAAAYLVNGLYGTIETYFLAARLALGADAVEPSVYKRQCAPPVFYLATPLGPPSTPSGYLNNRAFTLAGLLGACLDCEDPRAQGCSAAVVSGRLFLLRREQVTESRVATVYLMLPLGRSDGPFVDETVIGDTAWRLSCLELAIANDASVVAGKLGDLEERRRRWQAASRMLDGVVESGIGQAGRAHGRDLNVIHRSFLDFQAPVSQLLTYLEGVLSDWSELQTDFRLRMARTEDYVRCHLRLGPVSGLTGVPEGLLNAYPYHFQAQPVGWTVEQLKGSGRRTLDSLQRILDDATGRTRRKTDALISAAIGVLTVAAVAVGLSQFVPDAQIRAASYPGQLSAATYASLIQTLQVIVLITLSLVPIAGAYWLLRVIVGRARDLWRHRYLADLAAIGSAVNNAKADLFDEILAPKPLATAEASTSPHSFRSTSSDPLAGIERLDAKACHHLQSLWSELDRLERIRGQRDSSIRRFKRWLLRDASSGSRLRWTLVARQLELQTQVCILTDRDMVLLPRMACLIRFAGPRMRHFAGTLTMRRQVFESSMRLLGFTLQEIATLNTWLEQAENREWLEAADPEKVARELMSRGITADRSKRSHDQWVGCLG